jgi:hypothetical protein
LINLTPKQEIDDEWEEIKTAIVDAARNIIQTQSKPQRNKWWDEECKKIIQDKKRSKEKMVANEDKNNLEHIHKENETSK